MQRQRGGLIPIGDALSGMGGPMKSIREASPQALRHFTRFDQVNQLVSASEADASLGFMARMMALSMGASDWELYTLVTKTLLSLLPGLFNQSNLDGMHQGFGQVFQSRFPAAFLVNGETLFHFVFGRLVAALHKLNCLGFCFIHGLRNPSSLPEHFPGVASLAPSGSSRSPPCRGCSEPSQELPS